MNIRHFRELYVYHEVFRSTMDIFQEIQSFPREERYSTIDQIRRSSRSICANIAEAWGKRHYRNTFIACLSDAESEGAEILLWLQFSRACGDLDSDKSAELESRYERILGQIVTMISNSEDWVIRT